MNPRMLRTLKIFSIWLFFNYYMGVIFTNIFILTKITNNINIRIIVCGLIMALCEIIMANRIYRNNIDFYFNFEENENDNEKD